MNEKVLPLSALIMIFFLASLGQGCGKSEKGRTKDDGNIKTSWMSNVREYKKASIRFLSQPINHGNNYRILEVGTPLSPYMGIPHLLLKLPDGSVVDAISVDTHILKNMASSEGAAVVGFYNEKTHKAEHWPSDARHLQIGPWDFTIYGGHIVSLRVFYRQDSQWSWPNYVPAIGKYGESQMYSFPLRQEDVVQIFGVPDEITEYLKE